MILYENTIENYCESMRNRTLLSYLAKVYSDYYGREVTAILKMEWKYLLEVFYRTIQSMKAVSACGIRIDFCTSSRQERLEILLASEKDHRIKLGILTPLAWDSVCLDINDMVRIDEGRGVENEIAIHPSYQVISYKRSILSGLNPEELECVAASYLMNISRNTETDIEIGYQKQLIEEAPVIYAEEEMRFAELFGEILSGENGTKALALLHKKNQERMGKDQNTSLMYTDDQLLVISDVFQKLKKQRSCIYLINGQSGTGKSKLAADLRERAQRQGIPLFVFEGKEKFSVDEIPLNGVSVLFYDKLVQKEVGEAAEAYAQKNEIPLYRFRLHQNMSSNDSGSGYNFLSRCLQMDGNIRREEWNPEIFRIQVVDKKEDLPQIEGYASVYISRNLTFHTETEKVVGTNEVKNAVYKQLVKGRQGVFLFAEDDALQSYLKRQIQGAKSKYGWMHDLDRIVDENGDVSEDLQNTLLENTRKKNKIENQIIAYMGQEAWGKISEEAKKWILSGMIMFNDLKVYNQLMDFSGVCVNICKAVEYELSLRYQEEYIEFLIEKYGTDAIRKAPSKLLTDIDHDGEPEFLERRAFSLGNTPQLMGLNTRGEIANKYAWAEFSDYADRKLMIHKEKNTNLQERLKEQICIVEKIRTQYRNQAAHCTSIDAARASDCVEYVLCSQHKLGCLLDEFRF